MNVIFNYQFLLFTANSVSEKEFWKSVSIWRSYGQKYI